jgi:hypothetical protein
MQAQRRRTQSPISFLLYCIAPALIFIVTGTLMVGCGQTGAPQPPSLQLPAPVTDLTASRTGNRVALTWTMPRKTTDKLLLKGPQSVHICRKSAESASCAVVADRSFAPEKAATYEDPLPVGLSTGVPGPLFYSVQVVNSHGRSAGDSNLALTAAGPAPVAFADAHAQITADGVLLQWQAVPLIGDANKVDIDRTLLSTPSPARQDYEKKKPITGSSGQLVKQQTLTVRLPADQDPGKALDPDAAFDQRYGYRISRVATITVAGKPIEIRGESSPELVVDTKDTFPPQPPTGLAAVADPEAGAIDLSWVPNAEADLAGYAAYRREGDGSPKRLTPTGSLLDTPQFRDLTARPGVAYLYSVTAIDRDGNESHPSSEAKETIPAKQ